MNEPMNVEGTVDVTAFEQVQKPDTSGQAWLAVGVLGAGLLIAAIAAVTDNFVGGSPQKVPETVAVPVEESKVEDVGKPGGSSAKPWWASILQSPEEDAEREDATEPDVETQVETQVEVKVLVPRDENQVACTRNKGGEACFENDYLACVRFEGNRCIERKSLIVEEAPTASVMWRGRVLNGRAWR